MTTVAAGASKTFTAQVDNTLFVLSVQGGAIGSVTDVDGSTIAIGPNGTRRKFGPMTRTQSITVTMQVGSAEVEIDGWAGGVPASVASNSPLLPNGFSMIGDSRTADLFTGQGTNARNWFNWACAYYRQSPLLIAGYGVSGKRTDEFLTNGNFELALADSAKWLIFGFPVINDIQQANTGYVDTFGRSITLTNVATYALDNLIIYAKRAVAAGKSVILCTEPGGGVLNATQAKVTHEFNRALKERVKEVNGAILYDPCPIIWDPASSTTLIAFKTNYTSDGIHNQQMAARAVGADFATKVLPTLIPNVDTAPANLSDSIANGTNQLFRNPLFSTLTGGTNGGNFTLTSGTIPANVTISGTAAGLLSLTITSAANANGFGNDVTFAFTSTGVVSGRIDLDITNTDWNFTDWVEGRIEIDVASGGSGVGGVYAEMVISTNAGVLDYWANQASAAGPMSSAGDTGLVLRTKRGIPFIGSVTKNSMKLRVFVAFTGAGSQTITLRRPGVYRY